MDFIANDGSYAHRGVWHITDNLTVKHFEAEIKRIESSWRRGHWFIYDKPEHDIYRGDAICGQKDGMREGGLDWGHQKKLSETETLTTYRVKKANVIPDITSVPERYFPGPLCSRCARK